MAINYFNDREGDREGTEADTLWGEIPSRKSHTEKRRETIPFEGTFMEWNFFADFYLTPEQKVFRKHYLVSSCKLPLN